MTREECTKILAYLQIGSGSSKPVTREQAEVYFDFLKDLDASDVQRAAKQALAESQYPTIPPVGVLLKLAGATGSVDGDSRALVAYAAASSAVATEGMYASVDFADALVNATIRSMGGWERFCSWPCDEVQWRQRDFERNYNALLRTGCAAELTAQLAGICETSNAGNGYENNRETFRSIEIDLPSLPRRLIRGDQPVKRIACEPVAAAVGQLASSLGIEIERPSPRREMTQEEFARHREESIRRIKESPVMASLSTDAPESAK